jgi:hypothetical protein
MGIGVAGLGLARGVAPGVDRAVVLLRSFLEGISEGVVRGEPVAVSI